MQMVMAGIALAVAAFIVWWSWRDVIARHSPNLTARFGAKRGHDDIGLAESKSAKLWFAPPADPVIEMKAARVRTEAGISTSTPRPSRARWNPEDDTELLQLVADGIPTADIATKLGRSENAVLLRIPILRLRHRQTIQAAE